MSAQHLSEVFLIHSDGGLRHIQDGEQCDLEALALFWFKFVRHGATV